MEGAGHGGRGHSRDPVTTVEVKREGEPCEPCADRPAFEVPRWAVKTELYGSDREMLESKVFEAPKEPEFVAVDDARLIKQETEEYDRLGAGSGSDSQWEHVMLREQVHETVWIKEEPPPDNFVEEEEEGEDEQAEETTPVALPRFRMPNRGSSRLIQPGQPKPPDDVHHCNVCKATFRGIVFFEKHMLTHKTGTFKCGECGREYKLASKLKHHMKKHVEKPGASFCGVCGKWYHEQEELDRHLRRTHQKVGESSCDSEGIDRLVEPADSVQRSEPPQSTDPLQPAGVNICPHCEEEFEEGAALEEHVKVHRYKVKECDHCGEMCLGIAALKEHRYKSHGIQKRKCDRCGEEFENTCDFEDHMKKHVCKSKKCPRCELEFNNLGDLKEHLKQQHNRCFPCTVCGKSFFRKPNLRVHMRIHTGRKPHKCKYCDKAFIWKMGLRDHMASFHSEHKPYKCTICKKEFVNKKYFEVHVQIHSGEKPFTCEVCGKGFFWGDSLKFHIHAAHNEDRKRFKCPECGKQFTQEKLLADHLRVHAMDNIFKCDVCGHVFTQKANLLQHRRIHSGEKPFTCGVCGKSVTTKSYLKAHMRLHYGDEECMCKICGKQLSTVGYLKKHMLRHERAKQKEKDPKGSTLESGDEAAPNVPVTVSGAQQITDLMDNKGTGD